MEHFSTIRELVGLVIAALCLTTKLKTHTTASLLLDSRNILSQLTLSIRSPLLPIRFRFNLAWGVCTAFFTTILKVSKTLSQDELKIFSLTAKSLLGLATLISYLSVSKSTQSHYMITQLKRYSIYDKKKAFEMVCNRTIDLMEWDQLYIKMIYRFQKVYPKMGYQKDGLWGSAGGASMRSLLRVTGAHDAIKQHRNLIFLTTFAIWSRNVAKKLSNTNDLVALMYIHSDITTVIYTAKNQTSELLIDYLSSTRVGIEIDIDSGFSQRADIYWRLAPPRKFWKSRQEPLGFETQVYVEQFMSNMVAEACDIINKLDNFSKSVMVSVVMKSMQASFLNHLIENRIHLRPWGAHKLRLDFELVIKYLRLRGLDLGIDEWPEFMEPMEIFFSVLSAEIRKDARIMATKQSLIDPKKLVNIRKMDFSCCCT